MNMHAIRVWVVLCVAATGLTFPCAASAQAYPQQRPVRVIVNVTAGGGTDILARLVAQHFAAVWGRPFVVDNRAGAGGNIGVELVVKAAPDGHTLLVSSSGVVTNAVARPEGYDPIRDLTPVAKLTSNPYVVCVTPTLPVASVKDLIALARAKPGSLTFASSGIGGILHMGAELLLSMTGVSMIHVPYKGVGDGYPAVMTGQVNWILGSPISALPLIKSGRMKSIAVTSATRNKMLPDLPAIAETVPGYEVVAWFGIFGPARLPQNIVTTLHDEAHRAMHAPEVLRRMELEATDVAANTPREFGAEVRADYEKWLQLVKKTGITF